MAKVVTKEKLAVTIAPSSGKTGPERRAAALARVNESASPRRRGRPAKEDIDLRGDQLELSREAIIQHATELSRELSLDDVSIVRLAKDFSVTPATIHYHLTNGRDELVSEVVSRYLQHLMRCFENVDGPWDERIRTVAFRLFKLHIEFKGVNAYLMSHNKFRLLQTASRGEQDLGIKYLDRFILLFKERGFDTEACVINVHQVAFFIASCAHAEIGQQLPAHHKDYLKHQLSKLTLDEAPNFRAAIPEFTRFDTEKMFLTGIEILIRGFVLPENTTKKATGTRIAQ